VKIKLDENLSRHLKDPLCEQGHECLPLLKNVYWERVDIELGAAAKGEDRMIFTLDLDFADLRKFPARITPWSHLVQAPQHGTIGG
jgi:predicted nuclease of predicted toxin-antitoxin system